MLTAADLIAIHELLIAGFGGMRGITEAGFGRLEGVAAAPAASAFGEPMFPDPVSQAAALCFALVRGHPFSDGNKRVALVALDVVLGRHGIKFKATNDEAYETIMALADGTMGRDQLIAWANEHI